MSHFNWALNVKWKVSIHTNENLICWWIANVFGIDWKPPEANWNANCNWLLVADCACQTKCHKCLLKVESNEPENTFSGGRRTAMLLYRELFQRYQLGECVCLVFVRGSRMAGTNCHNICPIWRCESAHSSQFPKPKCNRLVLIPWQKPIMKPLDGAYFI